jgi:hypothetical protein
VARPHLIALCFIAWMIGLSLVGLRRDSPTTDEPNHLVRGLAYFWTDDTHLSFAHPPLADALMALPAAVTSKPVDLPAYPGWKESRVDGVARNYFEADYGRARAQIFLGRHVTVLLSVLLALYLYRYCFARYGPKTALFVLALYCLHPTMMAHGRLVTTDMPLALATTVATGEFVAYIERPRWPRLLSTALAVGAALAVKFSAIFLIPLMLAMGGYHAYHGTRPGDSPSRAGRLFKFALHAAVVAVVAIAVVNAVYRFQRTGWTVSRMLQEPEPTNWISRVKPDTLLEEWSVLRFLPGWLPLPLPYTFVFGASTIGVQSMGGHASYFMGSTGAGWVAYFPVMLLIKNPLAVILLLAAALRRFVQARKISSDPAPAGRWARLWRFVRSLPVPAPALAIPIASAALFVGISMTSRINIGVRHVLPVIPMLLIVAGRMACLLWETADRRRRWLFGVVAAGTLASSLAWYRHPLGYFNLLSLGRYGGLKISIVGEDWGQDVEDLARQAQAEQHVPLYYYYSGWASGMELTYLGVPFTRLKCPETPSGPGWVAAHGARVVRRRQTCYGWLPPSPDRTVNGHIWLYQVQAAVPPSAASAPVAPSAPSAQPAAGEPGD